MMENLRQSMRFGGFAVKSFEAVHNVPCCGFLIEHDDLGRMLYVTDSEYVKYRFNELNVMLIEANYDMEYVSKDEAKYRHVLTGHMSIATTAECVKTNASESLNHIILCHLSARNSHPAKFKETIKAIAPAGCTVDIANKGMTVDLGEIPF